MPARNIRKTLFKEKTVNPFNDDYSIDEVKKLVEEYKLSINESPHLQGTNKDNFNSLKILVNTPIYNIYFQDLYEFMKTKLAKSEMNIMNIVKYLVAIVNHDSKLISSSVRKMMDSNQEIRLEAIATHEIDEKNKKNAIDSFELQTDILNLILNYLRYFHSEEGRDNYVNPEEVGEVAGKLYRVSNLLYIIKDAYDRVVWENGTIDKVNDELYLRHIEPESQMLQQIGLFRIQRNAFSYVVYLHQYFKEKPSLLNALYATRKGKSVSRAQINSRGFVRYQLSNDQPNHLLNSELLQGIAFISAFYPHFTKKELKNINNLTVDDLMILHNELINLTNKVMESLPEANTEVNPKDYIVRIRNSDLLQYLSETTKYSNNQINSYVDLIVSDIKQNSRIDLWKRPLIMDNEIYYLSIPSMQSPNYLHLIDEWLEGSGYSLEERGYAYENFIKNEIPSMLKSKGNFTLPTQNKFTVSKNKTEEIDLIIAFDDFVFIAEIKNVKYPMEPRDIHNAIKRLTDGADQIKRKTKFVQQNRHYFSDLLAGIDDKPFYSAVICNYPHFTGMKLNDVPVIDYMALTTYFDSGVLSEVRIENINTKLAPVRELRLWNNRKEFAENFPSYLEKPVVIEDLKSKYMKSMDKITLDSASPQMYIETFRLRADSKVNE